MVASSASEMAFASGAPSVNISFPIQGQQLPADHGYLVYSAISRAFPALHSVDWLGIELISGFPSGQGLVNLSANSKLGTQNSKLSLRLPADHYRDVLPLAGKRLDIGGHQIRLGLPVARPLEPAPSLYARVVTIKKFTEAEPFIEAVKRKLDSFGVRGRVELATKRQPKRLVQFLDRLFHESQRIVERTPRMTRKAETTTIEMQVAGGRGLLRFILSWGQTFKSSPRPSCAVK